LTQSYEGYPKSVTLNGVDYEIRRLQPDDQTLLQQFAADMPANDLLFLPRDIRQQSVVAAWVEQTEAGAISTIVVLDGAKLVGVAAVVCDELSYSKHVGDLRVLLSSGVRGIGLGRLLVKECYFLALARNLEKLTTRMTANQPTALKLFEELGFVPEALWRSQVRDETGANHDLVGLGQDVAGFERAMRAFGLLEG